LTNHLLAALAAALTVTVLLAMKRKPTPMTQAPSNGQTGAWGVLPVVPLDVDAYGRSVTNSAATQEFSSRVPYSYQTDVRRWDNAVEAAARGEGVPLLSPVYDNFGAAIYPAA
jgi:hypothetical protein